MGQEYPIPRYICCKAATLPASASSSIPTAVWRFHLVLAAVAEVAGRAHLLFWYHVFTWVSVRPSLAASSIRSCGGLDGLARFHHGHLY